MPRLPCLQTSATESSGRAEQTNGIVLEKACVIALSGGAALLRSRTPEEARSGAMDCRPNILQG
jgi:hypothetical protein